MELTRTFLEHPWLAPGLWAVLHSLDYSLTLVGAQLRQRRAARIIHVDGSYELNPLFQKAVDGQQWLSRRFLITLIVLGALLYAVTATYPAEGSGYEVGLLLGVVLFTRLAIIGRHLNNIWLYARMLRKPSSVTGSISYDRPTVYLMSAFSSGQLVVLLGAASLVEPDPWIVGGALGNLLLALLAGAMALRARLAAGKAPR